MLIEYKELDPRESGEFIAAHARHVKVPYIQFVLIGIWSKLFNLIKSLLVGGIAKSLWPNQHQLGVAAVVQGHPPPDGSPWPGDVRRVLIPDLREVRPPPVSLR